jgi:leucyl aminopeptidase
MKIVATANEINKLNEDVLVLGVYADRWTTGTLFKAVDAATKGTVSRTGKDEGFEGKRGEVLRFTRPSGLNVKKLVIIGLGAAPSAGPKSGQMGNQVAQHARYLGVKASDNAQKYKSVAVAMPEVVLGKIREKASGTTNVTDEVVRSLSEGLVMGAYHYTEYKTEKKARERKLESASIVFSAPPPPSARAAIERGRAVAQLIHAARDMVNCPPNDMHPRELANRAMKLSKEHGLHCTVLDKKQIEKKGMNLLLAVNRGSGEEPRFIHMSYKPKAKNAPKVVFVGKGLTFDSGGLCLKPSKAMLDMKCDMAGGAVTLAIVAAAAKLQLDVEVHGVVPSTENMTGEHAFRPGDVYKSMDGKTVEIINTDAEGRLILADALAYARALKPDVMVDHATLTGACMVALGQYRAGLFSTQESYLQQYQQASDATGERYWNLPLDEDLKDALKSDVADLKHTGESYGGAVTAALFLREFAGDVPWVHVDFAGPAFLDRAKGVMPKGATGFGILTAIRFLEHFTRSKS